VYFDFCKSFDIASHKLIVRKLRKCGKGEWTLRWIQNWQTGRAQRVVISGKEADFRPATSSVPQRSVLGLGLFNIFVSDLDEGIESILSKLADDTEMGDCLLWADTLEGCATFQQDLDRLESWAGKDLTRFNNYLVLILLNRM